MSSPSMTADCPSAPPQRPPSAWSRHSLCGCRAERVAIIDDLEAVGVELRLMQPGVASRDGLGGNGDAARRSV